MSLKTIALRGRHGVSRSLPIRLQDAVSMGMKRHSDVWIGAIASISDGAAIGQGAIIGAGAVVKKH